MNDDRRKELRRALELIGEAKGIVETCAEEESEYHQNMPESIQSGEKGDRVEEIADALQEAVDDLENVVTAIEETL